MAESSDKNLPLPESSEKPQMTLAQWELQWHEVSQLDLQTQVEKLKAAEAELSAKLVEAGK
ncbi:hypothetical protein NXS08_03570 [Gleimia sp. 6138-11-ORH1]|uniref:hypothetical protein n=1 Tax=Gleimia sp. 6138-11-ORH1 TaxID=2973937 RepID=UPI002166F6D1|nr:hypothetical protein [Gleimia sp. 6138-11-ORH1]MCS4484566.1 hypothetical protein [Gleimia sp. 6138-11-ORH1]